MPSPSPGILDNLFAMAVSEPTREQHKRDLAVEVLRTAGRVRLAARGYSMLPSLWPGDVLTIEASTVAQLLPADLVLYWRGESFFIHRVLRWEVAGADRRLVTRGDSMPGEDLPVSADEVLGKIVSVERDGRIVQVPRCTPLTRVVGLALTWGRLRSIVLRLRLRRAVRSGLGISPDGVVSL
jgi:hypothetical protein